MSASRVTGSVSELVSFINSKVQTNIVESNNRGEFDFGEAEIGKLLRIIEMSISEGFSLGMNNVESAVKEYKEEVQKTIKYKKEVRKARK